MMQRSVELRANSRRSRGKIAFSGRSGKSPSHTFGGMVCGH